MSNNINNYYDPFIRYTNTFFSCIFSPSWAVACAFVEKNCRHFARTLRAITTCNCDLHSATGNGNCYVYSMACCECSQATTRTLSNRGRDFALFRCSNVAQTTKDTSHGDFVYDLQKLAYDFHLSNVIVIL